jgi:pyruvate formate lyase activating enzyme
VDPRIPVHFSRYFPHHKMTERATPASALQEAHRIAAEKLSYIYVGNIMMEQGNDTSCAGCGSALVRRRGYSVDTSGMTDGNCRQCGRKADIVV